MKSETSCCTPTQPTTMSPAKTGDIVNEDQKLVPSAQ